ncbi:MAG: GPW/gp25 family protein [Fimbriimonas sp.]
MNVTKNFIGSGWKFPPRLDSRGRIELSHQEQDIEESIRMILMTRKGERPMRPKFGSDLHQLVFAPSNAGTIGLAKRFVMEALAFWEPRIAVEAVNAYFNQEKSGVLFIDISYRVVSTNAERNLVFPFYTIPGED